jgi:hypothetical protein
MKSPSSSQNTCLGILGALLLVSGSASAVIVDFNNPNDLANNFRLYPNSSSVSTVQSGTSVQVTGATFNTTPNILIYDTTPLVTTDYNTFALNIGQTLSVSVDVASITGAGSSLGFYFFNSAQTLTSFSHNTALMNFDNSGTNELARFGTYQAITGIGTTNGTPSTGNGITLNDPTFQTVTATYTRTSAQNIELTLNVGGFTSTFTNTNFASYTNVGIGIRVYPVPGTPANSYLFDNFTVNVVPEPSALTLAAVGLIGSFFGLQRRRNSAPQE